MPQGLLQAGVKLFLELECGIREDTFRTPELQEFNFEPF